MSLIYSKFFINVLDLPTLPSLAFKIWRTHFIDSKLIDISYFHKLYIHNISGQVDNFIRQSYTGGAVDMYIPENLDNELVNEYDVNSLYPFQMKTKLMPTGKPVFKVINKTINNINDIIKIKELFGFFKCRIIAPDNLNHPILLGLLRYPTHVNTNQGIRTIAPLGTW